jgi:hypothetical protein
MQISRLQCASCGVALEGSFEVSALALLPEADQTFVHAFLRHHGSIKKMEKVFRVSYPTVKNRLNSIVAQLDEHHRDNQRSAGARRASILERLAGGEIDVDAALAELTPRNTNGRPGKTRTTTNTTTRKRRQG